MKCPKCITIEMNQIITGYYICGVCGHNTGDDTKDEGDNMKNEENTGKRSRGKLDKMSIIREIVKCTIIQADEIYELFKNPTETHKAPVNELKDIFINSLGGDDVKNKYINDPIAKGVIDCRFKDYLLACRDFDLIKEDDLI